MIVGSDGPAVILSAKTAHYLETASKGLLTTLRVRALGRDEQVSRELNELRQVAMGYRLPRKTEAEADFAEAAPDSKQWLSAIETADLVGITDRAVRQACQDGRLEAHQVGPSRSAWRISREAAEKFKDERTG